MPPVPCAELGRWFRQFSMLQPIDQVIQRVVNLLNFILRGRIGQTPAIDEAPRVILEAAVVKQRVCSRELTKQKSVLPRARLHRRRDREEGLNR